MKGSDGACFLHLTVHFSTLPGALLWHFEASISLPFRLQLAEAVQGSLTVPCHKGRFSKSMAAVAMRTRQVADLQAMSHVFQQAQSLSAEAVLTPCTAAQCTACWLAPQKAGSQDSSIPAQAACA